MLGCFYMIFVSHQDNSIIHISCTQGEWKICDEKQIEHQSQHALWNSRVNPLIAWPFIHMWLWRFFVEDTILWLHMKRMRSNFLFCEADLHAIPCQIPVRHWKKQPRNTYLHPYPYLSFWRFCVFVLCSVLMSEAKLMVGDYFLSFHY